MNEVTEDHAVQPTRKRMRRNAIKPNSAESDALKEFSVLHTLNEKMDMNSSDSEKRARVDETTASNEEKTESSECSEVPETEVEVQEVITDGDTTEIASEVSSNPTPASRANQ